MRSSHRNPVTAAFLLFMLVTSGGAAGWLAKPLAAQAPPAYPSGELDQLVSRIALYPDPLLGQILAAATFPDQIPDAARWADNHHYLAGAALARAISEDSVPWDPSVQALLPFPSVLDMMASDMGWTTELGNAFLAQQQEVLDAVQRMRREASEFGYLRSNAQVVVTSGPYIGIMPADPAFICVPYYDPLVVFGPPRPGIAVAVAINWGYRVPIGPVFAPWGWGGNRIAWASHAVIINHARWARTWSNRASYVHAYRVPRYQTTRRPEHHRLIPPTERERRAERSGRAPRAERGKR